MGCFKVIWIVYWDYIGKYSVKQHLNYCLRLSVQRFWFLYNNFKTTVLLPFIHIQVFALAWDIHYIFRIYTYKKRKKGVNIVNTPSMLYVYIAACAHNKWEIKSKSKNFEEISVCFLIVGVIVIRFKLGCKFVPLATFES